MRRLHNYIFEFQRVNIYICQFTVSAYLVVTQCCIGFEQFAIGVPIVVNKLSLMSINYFEASHSTHSCSQSLLLFQLMHIIC